MTDKVKELLPCPFCGGSKLELDNLVDADDYCVECKTCQLGQHAVHTRDGAIAAWNRRPAASIEQEQQVAQDGGLYSALRKLVFAARTSGGVAGRDEGLCAACDEAEAVLATGTEPTTPDARIIPERKSYPSPLEIAEEWKDWIPYPDSPQSEWDRFNLADYMARAIIPEGVAVESIEQDARRFLFMAERDLTDLYADYWSDRDTMPDDLSEAIDRAMIAESSKK